MVSFVIAKYVRSGVPRLHQLTFAIWRHLHFASLKNTVRNYTTLFRCFSKKTPYQVFKLLVARCLKRLLSLKWHYGGVSVYQAR